MVTSRKRPDFLKPDDEIVVIRLGGISASHIPGILNRLSQDLASGRARTGRLLYEEIKQRLLRLVAAIRKEREPSSLQYSASEIWGQGTGRAPIEKAAPDNQTGNGAGCSP